MNMRSKKVMHVTETMAAGVLTYLKEITKIDLDADTQHYILYSDNRAFTPDQLSDLFPTSVRLIPMNIQIKRIRQGLREIDKAIRQINPDIIHLHSSVAGLFGRILSIAHRKIRFYYTPHGYSFLMTSRPVITRFLYASAELVLSQLKCDIIACSKSEHRYAERLSWIHSVQLVENAVRPLGEVADNKIKSFLLVGVGRLDEQKDPLLFIRIVARLRRIRPGIQAVWIGDGALKQECLILDKQLQANIQFTGWLSHEETIKQMQLSTIFLQTSKWEGLPFSVLEAMSTGLPVVASNKVFHRDLFEYDYRGLLAGNEEEFVECVCNLQDSLEWRIELASFNRKQLAVKHKRFVQAISTIYN
jgi:hypothetical protein